MALLTSFIVNTDYYFPYTGLKGVYFMAAAEITFFAWAALALKFKQYRPDFKNPVVFSVMLFLAVLFASAVFGANFANSFWSNFERMGGLLMFCHLTAFFVVVATVFEKRDWIKFFSASVVTATIVGVEALLNQNAASRSGGFIGNDSFLGAYLLFNIFIALYLLIRYWKAENKIVKIFSGISFLILSFFLMLEGTQTWANLINANFDFSRIDLARDIFGRGARAAKIAFLAGMILLTTLRLATSKKTIAKIIGRGLLAFATVASFVFVFMATRAGNPVYQSMVDRFGKGTVYGRLVVWEIAWKGFLERPLLGWGPENFDLVFARHYNPCLGSHECGGEIWFDRAHNIVFDLLAEVGALGFLAYLGMFAAAIFVLWKGYFQNKFGFAEAGVFTSLLAAYFLQNLTVFDMTASHLMFFSCLGFAAFCENPKSERAGNPAQLTPFRNFPAITIFIVAIICFFNFVIGPWGADRYVLQTAQKTIIRSSEGKVISEKENNPFGSPARLDFYQKSIEASPVGRFQARLFFSRMWLEALEVEGTIAQIDRQQINAEFEFIAGQLQKSVVESPLDFKSWLKLGEIYNKWSLFDKSKLADAENALQKAIQLAPNNQLSYWHLAQTRLYQLRADDAESLAQQAYDLYPKSAKAQKVLEEIKKIQEKIANTKK